MGWLADKFDRRHVLNGLSAATIASCIATASLDNPGTTGVMLAAFLFGLTSFPIFSVASAHANDFARSAQRVELSAALMFFYAIGAIAAPVAVSKLIEWFGPNAMFTTIAVGHGLLILVGGARMRARPTRGRRTRSVGM